MPKYSAVVCLARNTVQKGGNRLGWLIFNPKVFTPTERRHKMPKMKTHRAAAKRYKVTGTGKITRRHAGIGHLLQHKSESRKRKIFGDLVISETHEKLVSKELPYKKYSR
jgi:large subunit ribosomal protein L35